MRGLEIRPGLVGLCILICFLFPATAFWPFLLLGTLHELGHLAALTLCAVPVTGVRLGAFGAVIDAGPMGPAQEVFCALAGPAVNLFAFWALRRAWPGAAVVSLVLGLCNLLPIRPMDGGRALWAVLIGLLPLSTAMAVCGAMETLALCALGIGALALCRRFGAMPAMMYALLLVNLGRERKFLLPSGKIADIMEQKKLAQEV